MARRRVLATRFEWPRFEQGLAWNGSFAIVDDVWVLHRGAALHGKAHQPIVKWRQGHQVREIAEPSLAGCPDAVLAAMIPLLDATNPDTCLLQEVKM